MSRKQNKRRKNVFLKCESSSNDEDGNRHREGRKVNWNPPISQAKEWRKEIMTLDTPDPKTRFADHCLSLTGKFSSWNYFLIHVLTNVGLLYNTVKVAISSIRMAWNVGQFRMATGNHPAILSQPPPGCWKDWAQKRKHFYFLFTFKEVSCIFPCPSFDSRLITASQKIGRPHQFLWELFIGLCQWLQNHNSRRRNKPQEANFETWSEKETAAFRVSWARC